ncbi:hypothetical protein J2S98_004585 [Arthrobacter oryzae]|nr:hypothetical protein [Arthrobacter oryzae]
MKLVILVITAWVSTGLIALLGVSAGATIWFYMEPVVDSVPDPASYFVAVSAGFLALILSFSVSVGISVHAARFAGPADSPQADKSADLFLSRHTSGRFPMGRRSYESATSSSSKPSEFTR